MKKTLIALELELALATPYYAAFDGEEGGGDTGGGEGGGDNGGGDNGGGEDKKFSQADVDRMMANHRKGLQQNVSELTAQLETLKSSQHASQEEKDNLQASISQLESQLLTEKEIAERDRKKLASEKETALESVTSERDMWRGRFESTLVQNSLTQAAVEHKAFSPEQITRMFSNEAKTVEIMKDGKGTGQFEVRMTVSMPDGDSGTKQLEMSASEAIKELASRDQYANMFGFDGKTGLGRKNLNAGSRAGKVEAASDMKSYRENRDNILKR